MRSSSIMVRDYRYWNNLPRVKNRPEVFVQKLENKRTCFNLLKYITVVIFYALILVFLSTQSSILGYKIHGLQQDILAAETQQHGIESRISTLSSAPTIEAQASGLGMHSPEDADRLLVNEQNQLVSASYDYQNNK